MTISPSRAAQGRGLVTVTLVSGVLQACSPQTTRLQIVQDEYRHCEQASCGSELVAKYKLGDPVWRAGVVSAETVFPLHLETGRDAIFDLWRPANAILEVGQRDGKKLIRGADYNNVNGKLVLNVSGNAIFVATKSYLYAADGKRRITEEIQDKQLRVTYTSDTPAAPPPKPKQLPLLRQKLNDGEPVYITFYGDSITAGLGSDPGASYPELTAAYLSNKYNGRIYWRNRGVVGWTSRTGLLNIDEMVNNSAQDVLVIAFGMNDALVNTSGWRGIFNRAKEMLGLGERGRFKRDTLAMIDFDPKTPSRNRVCSHFWHTLEPGVGGRWTTIG